MSFARPLALIMVMTAAGVAHANATPPMAPTSPENAYTECSGEFERVSGVRGKLGSLRRCRGRIEHFQTTYLQSYGIGLQRYRARLMAYRDEVKSSSMSAQEKQAARQLFEREMERLQAGGDLYDAHMRMTDRARRDLEYINDQICRLGRLGGPVCR